MSTEQGAGETSQKTAPHSPNTTDTSTPQQQSSSKPPSTPINPSDESLSRDTNEDKKKAAEKPDQKTEATSPSTPDDPRSRPRQVIAVSASKGPAAFFNLARKFLVTDELCDLSALEGAIVSAADAAHLLERSKLATIVRVQTSYVTVEPKRRRQDPSPQPSSTSTPLAQQHETTTTAAAASKTTADPSPPQGRPSSGRELRRARIVITVKRTQSYKQWLEDNPLQAVIAGDGDDDGDEVDEAVAAQQQQR